MVYAGFDALSIILTKKKHKALKITFYNEIISISMEKMSPEYGSSLTVLSHLASSQLSGRGFPSAYFKV